MNMNSKKTEEVPCPLCASNVKAKAYLDFYPYGVVRCKSCNLYYLSPRLTEETMLNLYSKNNYFEGEGNGYQDYLQQEKSLRATFRQLLINLSDRKLTGGRLLEIGCGYGYLLDESRNFFKYRVGTDFSATALEYAKNRADRVVQGGIDAVPNEELFDCIISSQVIEHVYDPKKFLQQTLSRLKPKGKVVIATPDMGSFWRYLMGHKWSSFKLPEHILFFDKKTLSSLMKEVGIVNVKAIPYPHAFPLTLVASKLHIKLPSFFNKYNLWIPATTLALSGTKK